ncbi:TrkH family potassium uptake protein [Candidatus Marinimicrobia bacterium]|nr:TrkH family potassium uptake protein [Candidatus Neomarinimicrobiota bacterium]MDA9841705.1 TrkH family potassium uptake protein [Candidatus Neomarinimicrobiota bacterium]MDB3887672.1 TrkH family potassium uptake protein [Candidatus Neomarinimicrobiota bacterium]MDC0878625.1 TrkH family potassium uptake protein [Candidatus Neomarinimicrobiota bacterium]MDC1000497.1 TrkH family potassium uptake protein [Candidatus Neomarinimicrobiota bacterium]
MFLSIFLLFPAVIDFIDTKQTYLFKIAGISFATCIPIWYLCRKATSFSNKDVFLVIVLSWIIASVFGSLPFYYSGFFNIYTNALFEAVSGVTTTGATILDDIESLPKSILFWRAFLQWIGGLGIVVFTIALLPLLGVSGEKLFNVEYPGPSSEKITPRIKDTARLLLSFYVGFTFLEFTLLSYSMPFFDAICHALTTMPTGGFSTFNDSINSQGAYVKSVILLFMIIGGTNFALHFRVVKAGPRAYLRDREFLYYIGLIALASIAILFTSSWYNEGSNYLDTTFQVVAILTSTGYTATDYSVWQPFIKQFLLFGLMFVGAMGGSTSGGIKLIRIVAIVKYAGSELKRSLHSKAIIPIRLGQKVIPDEVIRKTLAFFLFYVAFFFIASFLFVMLGDDLQSSLGAAASGMGNIGPSWGSYGAMNSYSLMPMISKYIMMFCMLLGRLEIFAVLVLFTKTFWRS